MAIHKGIRIHQYLDDWLVRATSHQACLQHTQDLVQICQELGWLVNLDKSELEPKQVFDFLGYQFDLRASWVRPTPDRWQNLQDKILEILSLPTWPTITPNKTCTANLYRRIKRRVGCSLKQTHSKRGLVTTRKQVAYKLSGSKSSLPSLEKVSRHLCQTNSSGGHQQHYSSVIHKQRRRNEVRPSMCPSVEDLNLVYQEPSNSKPVTSQAG